MRVYSFLEFHRKLALANTEANSEKRVAPENATMNSTKESEGTKQQPR
jgi:hypothetical protein